MTSLALLTHKYRAGTRTFWQRGCSHAYLVRVKAFHFKCAMRVCVCRLRAGKHVRPRDDSANECDRQEAIGHLWCQLTGPSAAAVAPQCPLPSTNCPRHWPTTPPRISPRLRRRIESVFSWAHARQRERESGRVGEWWSGIVGRALLRCCSGHF